ncbi:MAG: 2Fe-2S iron-sulfur cluster-binding protein [Chitinophagaceae bacterium]
MYTIRFKLEQLGLPPIVLQKIEPGYSLLEIAITNSVILRHDCGGICSCSTCHIYLEKGNGFVCEMSNREKDFIGKVANLRPASRLACQCLLKDGSGTIEVTVPVQAT